MSNASAAAAPLLTIKQIANRFVVSQKTVRRWIKAGELRVHRLGRQIRITEEDAVVFLARQRR